MTRKEIENYLLDRKGYLKCSPIKVAQQYWKQSSKHDKPKNETELKKELKLIGDVISAMRLAQTIEEDTSKPVLQDLYHAIINQKDKPLKKLFFDLEVSANIVFSWRIGREVSLSPEDIIQERSIICACYKWEGDNKVYSIEWKSGDDKELLEKFSKIIDSADIVIGQNSDKFDIKWLRARCIYHSIPISPKFQSIDTLKMARAGFNFNSNKLDYMGQFLGIRGKIKTEYDLWKKITLENDKESMKKMVEYCKNDVTLLEDVYHKLENYCPKKRFKVKL